MNARAFPQSAMVAALFATLSRASNEAVSARSLAAAVAPRFPDVPPALIRTLARTLLRLAFDPEAITDEQVTRAADSPQDAADALRWLGEALRSEADALRCEAESLRSARPLRVVQ